MHLTEVWDNRADFLKEYHIFRYSQPKSPILRRLYLDTSCLFWFLIHSYSLNGFLQQEMEEDFCLLIYYLYISVSLSNEEVRLIPFNHHATFFTTLGWLFPFFLLIKWTLFHFITKCIFVIQVLQRLNITF